MNNYLPFTAIVGMELVKKSLLYHAIDPRLGGILLMGHRGCAKSTIARAFRGILPTNNSEGIPFVEVPLGTTEDRLLGSIDASRLLEKGEWSSKIGLIQQANGGVLYIDEINLLQDYLVDSLLDSSTTGKHHIEREGFSQIVNARYILIGSMNPDEGDLRPQLTDRFTHGVLVRDDFNTNQRKEIVRTCMEFDDDPSIFIESHKKNIELLKKQIIKARENLKNVEISEQIRNSVAKKASLLNLEGLRAEIGVLRTVRCASAWRNDKVVSEDDLEEAWELCLAHRKDDFKSKKQNSKTEKKNREDKFDEKVNLYRPRNKTSNSPLNAREDKILLDQSKNIINSELTSWWVSYKNIKRVLNSFVSGAFRPVKSKDPLSRVSWYSSLLVSILNGWAPGQQWHIRFSKPERRNNFWIFLDASRSTGALNFLGKAIAAVNELGSKTLKSQFYVLVLQNGELHWMVKRGTLKSFSKNMIKLKEAAGKSNLFLALEKLNSAVKKNGFLDGDRVLICSDGMFNKEKGVSVNESKVRFRKLLSNLSEQIPNLGWLYPKMDRGMQHWLPNLTKGIDVHLISLNNNDSQYKK